MRQDKKVERGQLTFILARGIGESFVARDVDEASVSAFLTRELAGSGVKAGPARITRRCARARIAPWRTPSTLSSSCSSVAAAAFFAGAETALTAASRARMHALETAGDKRAKLVTRLIGMRGRLISAMLLGGQLVTIGSSAIATSVLLEVFGERGVWAATAIMTALIVVFGEVMPKTIAIAYPDRVSLADRAAGAVLRAVFGPIVSAVEMLVRGVLRLWRRFAGRSRPRRFRP